MSDEIEFLNMFPESYELEQLEMEAIKQRNQKLFDYLYQEFGITPLQSEMSDLVEVVRSLPRYKPQGDGRVAELENALGELVDLTEDIRSGDYKPDSLTTQPARLLFAKHKQPSPQGDRKQLVAKFMLDHGFSTGKAESIPDLLGELSKQIFEMRQGQNDK